MYGCFGCLDLLAFNDDIMNKDSIYLPGLNGLRAIAALSVLWGHCFQKDFGDWGVTGWPIPLAIDGVTMFFVISGFLITFLLLNEFQQSGTISVPKFYMRRILRIWPIYYGYIIVAVLVLLFFNRSNELLNSTLWYYAFFTANIPFISAAGLWPIVHYWSLGVEEQFYLFWPWLAKLRHNHILLIAVAILLFWIVCKYASLLFFGHGFLYRFFSVTRFDCMMLGAVGAILFFRRNSLFLRLTANRGVSSLAWLALLGSALYAHLIPAPLRCPFFAVLSLLLIMSQVSGNHFFISLENRPFDFVGKISYGVYVIHPLLIFVLSYFYRQFEFSWHPALQCVAIYFLITASTLLLAYLSYTYFQKPFLRLKNRFAVVKSRNSISLS